MSKVKSCPWIERSGSAALATTRKISQPSLNICLHKVTQKISQWNRHDIYHGTEYTVPTFQPFANTALIFSIIVFQHLKSTVLGRAFNCHVREFSRICSHTCAYACNINYINWTFTRTVIDLYIYITSHNEHRCICQASHRSLAFVTQGLTCFSVANRDDRMAFIGVKSLYLTGAPSVVL